MLVLSPTGMDVQSNKGGQNSLLTADTRKLDLGFRLFKRLSLLCKLGHCSKIRLHVRSYYEYLVFKIW